MAPLEALDPVHLAQLLFPRRPDGRQLHAATCALLAVPSQPDDRAGAIGDLALVAVGGGLDLAALVAGFHGWQYAAEAINLAELGEDAFFHRALDGLHAGRAAEQIHRVLEQ